MKKNRILLTGILMTLMVGIFTSFAMPAQAVNRHKQVQKTVESFYRNVRANDKNGAKKYVLSSAKMFNEGRVTHAFWPYLKKYHKDLYYEVKSVNVKGKNATVRVRVQYQDLSEGHYQAISKYSDWFKGYYIRNNGKQPSSKAVQDKYRTYFKRALRDHDETYYDDKIGTIKLKRNGEKWKISKFNNNSTDTITAGYQTAYNEFF